MCAPEENSEFFFPRVSMFSKTKSREILRLEGKQNSLFPEGADILSALLYSKERKIKERKIIVIRNSF